MLIFYSTLCSIFILADVTFAIGKICYLDTFVQKILDSNELRNIENGVSVEEIKKRSFSGRIFLRRKKRRNLAMPLKALNNVTMNLSGIFALTSFDQHYNDIFV